MKRDRGARVELRLLLTIWLVALILWIVPMSVPYGQRLVQLLEGWLNTAEFRCMKCGNRNSLPADPPPSHYQSCSAGCGGKMIPVITIRDMGGSVP